MTAHRLSGNLRQHVLAGHATITLRNTRTGNHLTYRVRQCKDNPALYFVAVLTGSDNERDYTYLGCLRAFTPRGTTETRHVYVHGKKSRISAEAQSAVVFRMAWERMETLPPTIEVFHAGECLRCGKQLTVPASITSGYGPECTKRIASAAAPQRLAAGW